jgi:hypothetical protein
VSGGVGGDGVFALVPSGGTGTCSVAGLTVTGISSGTCIYKVTKLATATSNSITSDSTVTVTVTNSPLTLLGCDQQIITSSTHPTNKSWTISVSGGSAPYTATCSKSGATTSSICSITTPTMIYQTTYTGALPPITDNSFTVDLGYGQQGGQNGYHEYPGWLVGTFTVTDSVGRTGTAQCQLAHVHP